MPAPSPPRPDRPRYDLTVDVRPDQGVVEGDLAVAFTPDLPTDRLVFRLWANSPRTAQAGARLTTGPVSFESRPVASDQPDPTTLVVRTGALAPGATVRASMRWRLQLPGAVADRVSRTGETLRLGSFFPILPWEPGTGWATDAATSGFAESSTSPTADFTIAVTVPDGLTVLGTGVGPAGPGSSPGGGRWTAGAVRDLGLSIGRFTTATGTVDAGRPVQVTVGVAEGIAERPEDYLERAGRALADHARRFGPYPWAAYSLAVTPGLSGGIEYPMHAMQGAGSLGRTTSHEAAHMWFYALVGNNQGRDPWLDEGLATWAETRFEDGLGRLAAEAVPADGRGRVGEPMPFWEGPRRSAYFPGVYLQGAQALAALGDPGQVDCALRVFAAANAHRIAGPGDFIAAASTVFPDAAATLSRFGIRP